VDDKRGHAATSTAAPKPVRPDLRLSDLEYVAVLGEGAFGLVRLVRNKLTGETLALKQMQKARVVATNQQRNVMNEKRILSRLRHPYIIEFVKTFKDRDCLFLLCEYCPGGDLFGALLRVGGVLSLPDATWYAAVVTSVLDYLHSMDIVYRCGWAAPCRPTSQPCPPLPRPSPRCYVTLVCRDLKPENLLLDREGFLKVCDFGFAKVVTDKTYTVRGKCGMGGMEGEEHACSHCCPPSPPPPLAAPQPQLCGTPEYLAPELVQSKGHGKGVDWWALGILVYEMLSGFSPFADHEDNNQVVIYKNILRNNLRFPSSLKDAEAKDLIKRLLTSAPAQRLGCLKGGGGDVKRHKFFTRIDWDSLMRKAIPPPIKPVVKSATDTSNFDEFTSDTRVQAYVDTGDPWDADF